MGKNNININGENILDTDLISIIMPTYNVQDYVAESIQSILEQTYTNFEFIIVDDCSTDNTYYICKEFAEKDDRIKVYRNEKNSKIEYTLNKALSYSSGKYIVRMDGDDISDVKRLETMKIFLDEHKEVKLVGTSAITINSDGEEIGKTTFLDNEELIKKTCLLKTPVVHIWMTYKSIYDELNGYRTLFATEDYDFVLRVLSKGYKVTNIANYFGYKIRVNRKGNSTSCFGVKKLKSSRYTAKLYIEREKKNFDSYSLTNCQKATKTLQITEKIYSLSNIFLYKAIQKKSQGKRISLVFYTLLSMISPYQILYLFRTYKYKKIVKGK